MTDYGRWFDARVAEAVYKRNLQSGAERLGYLGEVNPAIILRLLQLP